MNTSDTSIADSVWSAFERIAAEFPDDPGVVLTLRYHRWYLLQFPHAVAAADMTDPEGGRR